MWEKFDARKFAGISVSGDVCVPKAPWWLRLFRRLTWWKQQKRVVLTTSGRDLFDGFRIGRKPPVGPARILDQTVEARRFQLRVGREGCTFFAVSLKGHEVQLILELETYASDRELKGITLY